MATAVTFGETVIPGMVLEGVVIPPWELLAREFKFWGVAGGSEISGNHGPRDIYVPLLIYDDAEEDPEFETAAELAAYILDDLNTDLVEVNHDLTITSLSGYPVLTDCVFKGFAIDPQHGIKHDDAGTLGGGYFAKGMLLFRQFSTTAVDEEEEP